MHNILTKPELRQLMTAFQSAGHQLRLVGGVVRDIVIGVEPKDIDLCTDATPEEMIFIAANAELMLIPTGIQHGTVTFVINHEAFEVTTLRIDVETDGRHADVEFTRSFEQDARRRDLTMNAMSMDFDGVVYDYFNGQQDIENNIVRFVGCAKDRIQEDYLRILRYFRFAARFQSHMDSNTLAAIRECRAGLDSISRERIWAELSKMFVAPGRVQAFNQMQASGVSEQIGLPWMFRSEFTEADCVEAVIASFFKGDEPEAQRFCSEMKMSSAETKKICWIAANYKALQINRRFVEDVLNASVPRDYVVSLMILFVSDFDCNHGLVQYAQRYQVVPFPVRGQDLVDLGFERGPAIGMVLTDLRKLWQNSRYTSTRRELLETL